MKISLTVKAFLFKLQIRETFLSFCKIVTTQKASYLSLLHSSKFYQCANFVNTKSSNMKATNKEISDHFSKGNFPFCYNYFADNMEWNLVGNEITRGKNSIIEHCNKMTIEMSTATLRNTNIIGENENIAIEGICSYTDSDNNPAELAYCDVFRFANDKIVSITSYCIEKKSK
jgi:ketosteroid isomerase-like protein